MYISIRDGQQHVRIEIFLVCKKTISLVTAVFEIGLIFCISCRIYGITAPYQNYCKAVL